MKGHPNWKVVGHIQAGDIFQDSEGSLAIERDHMFLCQMTKEELAELADQHEIPEPNCHLDPTPEASD